MTTENKGDATEHRWKHIKMELSPEDKRFFQREYLNVPQQEDPLRKFAEEYHRRCDEFDNTVCTSKCKHGLMPANAVEAKKCGRNASSVFNEIAVREHLSIRDFQNAIHNYRPKD